MRQYLCLLLGFFFMISVFSGCSSNDELSESYTERNREIDTVEKIKKENVTEKIRCEQDIGTDNANPTDCTSDTVWNNKCLAYKACSAKIAINPKDALAYYFRGYANDRLRDYRSCVSDFTKVLRITSEIPYAYKHRGYCYQWMRMKAQAISDFTHFINQVPGDEDIAEVYEDRALLRWDINDKAGAIADMEIAKELWMRDKYGSELYSGAVETISDWKEKIAREDVDKQFELYAQKNKELQEAKEDQLEGQQQQFYKDPLTICVGPICAKF